MSEAPPTNDDASTKHFIEIELSIAQYRALLKFKYVDRGSSRSSKRRRQSARRAKP